MKLKHYVRWINPLRTDNNELVMHTRSNDVQTVRKDLRAWWDKDGYNTYTMGIVCVDSRYDHVPRFEVDVYTGRCFSAYDRYRGQDTTTYYPLGYPIVNRRWN